MKATVVIRTLWVAKILQMDHLAGYFSSALNPQPGFFEYKPVLLILPLIVCVQAYFYENLPMPDTSVT